MIIPEKSCLVLVLGLLLASAQSSALTSTTLTGAALNSAVAYAETTTSPATTAWQFQSESEVLTQLPKLEQEAVTENKLLLVVLGANWCHDSVKLLERFNQPEMAQALTARFNMAFVDVAYLEFGKTTAERYQLPLYYGTPTVLIIQPKTRQLLNKSSLMHWTNAASLPVTEYQQYFLTDKVLLQYQKEQQQVAGLSAQLQQQIRDFEQQQAKTLAQAYLQLRSLLKAYKESGKPAGAEFKQRWDQVKAFRNNILPQVNQLQQQAANLAPGEALTLPAPAASF